MCSISVQCVKMPDTMKMQTPGSLEPPPHITSQSPGYGNGWGMKPRWTSLPISIQPPGDQAGCPGATRLRKRPFLSSSPAVRAPRVQLCAIRALWSIQNSGRADRPGSSQWWASTGFNLMSPLCRRLTGETPARLWSLALTSLCCEHQGHAGHMPCH